jgi:hypothetical protein
VHFSQIGALALEAPMMQVLHNTKCTHAAQTVSWELRARPWGLAQVHIFY